MSMYKDDDRAQGETVRGAAVLEEVVKVATRINAREEVDTVAVRNILKWLRDSPEERQEATDVATEILTWEEFEKAVRKCEKGKGLGTDGFDGYLLRLAPEGVQRRYHRTLQQIVATKSYPATWNEWIAMLAPKPGEDPKQLSRRDDEICGFNVMGSS